MYFESTNQVQLKGNNFNRHFYGLRITTGASIGLQKNNGNLWLAPPLIIPLLATYEAWNENLNNVGISKFQVNPFAPNPPEIVPDPRFPFSVGSGAMHWFEYNTDLNFECSQLTGLVCDHPGSGFTDLDKRDTMLALGTFSANAYATTAEYIGRRQLYRKIHENNLAPNCALFQGFCQNNTSTCVGHFDNINIQTSNALRFSVADESQLAALQQLCRQYLDTLRYLDSAYTANPDTTTAQQRSLVVDAAINNLQQQQQIIDIHQANSQILLTAIDNQNAALVTTISPEEIEKQVNDIYLKTVAQNSLDFTPNQITTLQTISALCPLEYGMAVYSARGILLLTQPVLLSNDDACNNPSLRVGVDNVAEKQMDFTLYPNPAHNQLTISYPAVASFSVEILDITGKMALPLQNSNSNTFTLSLQGIPAGLYICRINTTNTSASQRFIVVK